MRGMNSEEMSVIVEKVRGNGSRVEWHLLKATFRRVFPIFLRLIPSFYPVR